MGASQAMERYNNLSMVSENREPQRAYYIPFGDRGAALTQPGEASDRYISLNGTWGFGYFETPLDLPEDAADIVCGAELPVPSCWELSLIHI